MVSTPNFYASFVRSTCFVMSLGLLSWLMMQVLHELGHVIAAWAVGSTVVNVDLHPLRISETTISPQPVPRIVIWARPVLGSLLPILIWISMRKSVWSPCFRFFAGFCLIANGAYLGSGVWEPVGDAFDLVQASTPRWQLGLFGAITLPCGIWYWDGLQHKLGIGSSAEQTSWQRFFIIAALLTLLIMFELIYDSPAPR